MKIHFPRACFGKSDDDRDRCFQSDRSYDLPPRKASLYVAAGIAHAVKPGDAVATLPVNVRVRFTQTSADDRRSYRLGDFADLHQQHAEQFVRAGHAEIVAELDVSAPVPAAVASSTTRRRALTDEECETAAAAYLWKHPTATSRELAAAIPCAHGRISGLRAWQNVQHELNKGRKPATVALTDAVLRTFVDQRRSAGSNDRDET